MSKFDIYLIYINVIINFPRNFDFDFIFTVLIFV
jgi:hypothetical protein